MMMVSNEPAGATAKLNALQTIHTDDEWLVKETAEKFLLRNGFPGEKIDLLITGENGEPGWRNIISRWNPCFPKKLPLPDLNIYPANTAPPPPSASGSQQKS